MELAVFETAPAHPADRPTIVLVHGYPDTHTVWDLVAPGLTDQFHVVTYDVRGAGGSTAPAHAAGYDLERLADDFAAICAATAGPDRPVHLVGHDWGAIQGWEFVTAPRFAGSVASFTAVAGPALGHVLPAERPPPAVELLRSLPRLRRSWYIVPLCLAPLTDLVWGGLIDQSRWRRYLQREGAALDADYPPPSLARDARRGANLYRRNIARPLLSPGVGLGAHVRRAHAPVQLVVPARDRFIAPSYYDAAATTAPGLRRKVIPGSHWAPRTHPELLASWIAELARESGG